MIRIFVMMAIGLFMFAGAAQAEVVRIGRGTTSNRSESTYFDTYPGAFCGVKAIRIEVNGAGYGGLVYYSFQPNKPWIFSAKARVGAGWNQVPKVAGAGCLQRVRVYVPRTYPSPGDDEQTVNYFFTVYGLK